MVNTEIKHYILCSQIWRSYIQTAKTRPGTDCGSGHELLIAKFRLKLKKVGKTTRPFTYDLNHIIYDYTVEERNRFKELDLIECLENYGQRIMTLYRRQRSRPSPRKRNAKWQNDCLRREALQTAEKRREAKVKEKERYTHLKAESQRIARRDKAFLSDQCKEIEENYRLGRTREMFKKIRDTNGTLNAKMGTIKDLTEEDIKKRWQEYTELYKKRSSWPRKP